MLSKFNHNLKKNKIDAKNFQKNKKKLTSKEKKLKKIISVINYLNNHSIDKNNKRKVHYQNDFLNVLNSNLENDNFKKTTINTLRANLRELIKIKALYRKILTFQNNTNQFKGKLCIYQISKNAFPLIENYCLDIKDKMFEKVNQAKLELKTLSENEESKLKNITRNISRNINHIINNNNKSLINNSKNSKNLKKSLENKKNSNKEKKSKNNKITSLIKRSNKNNKIKLNQNKNLIKNIKTLALKEKEKKVDCLKKLDLNNLNDIDLKLKLRQTINFLKSKYKIEDENILKIKGLFRENYLSFKNCLLNLSNFLSDLTKDGYSKDEIISFYISKIESKYINKIHFISKYHKEKGLESDYYDVLREFKYKINKKMEIEKEKEKIINKILSRDYLSTYLRGEIQDDDNFSVRIYHPQDVYRLIDEEFLDLNPEITSGEFKKQEGFIIEFLKNKILTCLSKRDFKNE